MLIIIPLDKNVIYSFLCSFEDIGLNDKLIYQRLVDMFLNRVVLFDDHCDIYFNTNDDKTKQLKLKEQPDLKSEILFESNKNTQLNLVFSWVQIGGGLEIRTLECFHIAGFQDRCFRPLSQTSVHVFELTIKI